MTIGLGTVTTSFTDSKKITGVYHLLFNILVYAASVTPTATPISETNTVSLGTDVYPTVRGTSIF